MSWAEEYRRAQRAGQKSFRACVAKGEYPYLQVLDDILENGAADAAQSLGIKEIPAELFAGTKTDGRKTAFAPNFMPLLDEKTEFARKWMELCRAQQEEGIREPVQAFEFMNRFYVQEGNKRVSVLKYFGAASIRAQVTRILPKRTGTPENELYFEFLDFYQVTQLNTVWFSRPGSYARLCAAAGHAPGEVWPQEDRLTLASLQLRFSHAYKVCGGARLAATPSDALLAFVGVYGYKTACAMTPSEMVPALQRIWAEVLALGEKNALELSMQPQPQQAGPLWNRLLGAAGVGPRLCVAFLHERTAETSAWTYAHEMGRGEVQRVFHERVETWACEGVRPGEDDAALLEQAVARGADVVFTTTPKLMPATLKAAVTWPQVKFLNCSLHMTHPYVRTYYGRIHEAKFILGAIAGSMAQDGRLGYIASYPTYGMTAGVNAFALGAQMANPRAVVYLDWTARRGSDIERDFREKGIRVISNVDMNPPAAARERFGLYEETPQGVRHLAMPLWNWGEFYTKILRSIFDGTWKQAETQPGAHAVNYWWGLSAGVVDVLCSHSLPQGTLRLAGLLKKAVAQGLLQPFSGPLYAQQGPVQQTGGTLAPQDVITMDWLCSNVVGRIPAYDELIDEAKPMVRLQGVDATEKPAALI